jgi:DNA-binding CsgD family transcriptional regulator
MRRDAVTDSLVGRAPQLARLGEWVGDLAEGSGRAVLIEGEAGIGKSSILRSMAATAAAAGHRVYWGACEELSRAFPLLPILEALRVREAAGEPAYSERRAAIVETLRASSALGVSIDRVTAAVEQLVTLFDEACRAGPVVLVVDDLQWADEATVVTWARLARTVAQRPLLLVGTTRPVPQRDNLGALRRLVDAESVLRLRGLTPPEAAQLVEALVHGRPGARLLELAEGAAGNPFYLTELIAALTRGGRLTGEDGWVEATDGPTPSSLSAAIKDRLEFLTTSARALVRAAALLGLDFALSELLVVTGHEITTLMPALDEASAAGVLRTDGATLSFRHPLIRAALYDGIPPAVRAAWHRDLGRLLAQHGAAVEGVARQLLPALEGADPTPGAADFWMVTWLVEAGQQLIGQAPQAAIPLLRWAVAGTPAGTAPHNVLACRLADVLYRAGDAPGAAAVAIRALAQAPDPDLMVDLHWTLTQCRVMEGQCDEALDELDQALSSPAIAARHRARLLVLMARVLRSIGRVDEAGEVAQEALAAATLEDDRWTIGWALSVLTMVHGMRGEVDRTLPLYDRALAVSEGEPALADLRLMLQINQANSFGLLDRYGQAIAAVRAVRERAERAGNVLRLSQAQSLLADLLFVTGQWNDALSEVDNIDRDSGASKNPVVECYHHGTAAIIMLHRGEEGASAHLGAAEPYAAQIGKRVIYTLALARSLERERAEEQAHALAELREALVQSAEEPAETAALLADAVRLALREGDRGGAEAAAARAETLAHGSSPVYRQASAAHCRGLIDRDAARLIEAARGYGSVGRPLPRAQALEAAAVALAETKDVAAARACYNDAFAAYQELGAAWDMARIQATFRGYGIRRGPLAKHRRADHGWESLTPTEKTIVDLVARGLSNPQIAGQLFLSRRTVQGHVSHILAKLELHSRMDIAREAARREPRAPVR